MQKSLIWHPPLQKRYPQAKRPQSKEILEDRSIQLILSSGIPSDRAPLGIEVMRHGKDYLVDKPGIITLEQLEAVRRVQKETQRMYTIMYSERLENRATVRAGELVKAGLIGNVIQTIGMGPHRINPRSRPEWFFDKKYFGGIITDIGSHQFDQFYFSPVLLKQILLMRRWAMHYPQYPEFEDFGDVMIEATRNRLYPWDWFTPDGLNSWGDGRLTILGTEVH